MIVKYLHQRLPFVMAVSEHDDPQVMVLANLVVFGEIYHFCFL